MFEQVEVKSDSVSTQTANDKLNLNSITDLPKAQTATSVAEILGKKNTAGLPMEPADAEVVRSALLAKAKISDVAFQKFVSEVNEKLPYGTEFKAGRNGIFTIGPNQQDQRVLKTVVDLASKQDKGPLPAASAEQIKQAMNQVKKSGGDQALKRFVEEVNMQLPYGLELKPAKESFTLGPNQEKLARIQGVIMRVADHKPGQQMNMTDALFVKRALEAEKQASGTRGLDRFLSVVNENLPNTVALMPAKDGWFMVGPRPKQTEVVRQKK